MNKEAPASNFAEQWLDVKLEEYNSSGRIIDSKTLSDFTKIKDNIFPVVTTINNAIAKAIKGNRQETTVAFTTKSVIACALLKVMQNDKIVLTQEKVSGNNFTYRIFLPDSSTKQTNTK